MTRRRSALPFPEELGMGVLNEAKDNDPAPEETQQDEAARQLQQENAETSMDQPSS